MLGFNPVTFCVQILRGVCQHMAMLSETSKGGEYRDWLLKIEKELKELEDLSDSEKHQRYLRKLTDLIEQEEKRLELD